ncbi:tail fiber domain-containing protein [Phyllobacterium sp. LjRoot231]|uniref:tail fiber domain-containing protein n=1 Tax=Phyllobacterium sp. LjRoot231 TaxID=3342289 RepID=UPI003ECFE0BE
MGKDSSPAPSPDPQIGAAALAQAQTGQDWLSFAKDSFAVSTERQKGLDAITKQVTEKQLGVADQQAKWATEDRDRYNTVFKPVEDQFVQEASNYDTPEKQAAAAAAATADVQTASTAARAGAERNASAMGLNPTSGRYAGIERAGEMGTALATAGAANSARQAVVDKGLALKADVANMGRGLPAQSAQATALGLDAGSSAVGLTGSANAQQMQAGNVMNSGFSGQMQGYGAQASALNTQYSNTLNSWNAQQAADAASVGGIASAVGGIAGLIYKSDENVKEDKVAMDEGAGLDAVNAMPVEEWSYKPGEGDGGRHVGTYAQDFQRATGKGDGKSINAIDAIGITMKAVQDLSKKVDKVASAVGLGQSRGRSAPPPAARRNMPVGLGVAA